jgi:hypothetical protein
MKDAEKNSYKETALHAKIEKNLIEAYKRYIRTLDA